MKLFSREPAELPAPSGPVSTLDARMVAVALKWGTFNGRPSPCLVPEWDTFDMAKQAMLQNQRVVKLFASADAADAYVREQVTKKARVQAEQAERAQKEAARLARIAAIESAETVECDGQRIPSQVWGVVPLDAKQRLAGADIVRPAAK